MGKYLVKDDLVFNESGSFVRIGDYYSCNDQGNSPISIQCDGIGQFDNPKVTGKENNRTLTWLDTAKMLKITSRLHYDAETKIISRKDILHNLSQRKLVLHRYMARYPFIQGYYELFTQNSLWCHESQGTWNKIHTGSVTLFSRPGRWCEGSTPFAVLRDTYSKHALAFMVYPDGDYMLRFSSNASSGTGRLQDLTVELGLSDDRLVLELEPGECWEAPEIIIQILPGRDASSGTAAMDKYLNRQFPPRKNHFPVEYNTWLDRMKKLEIPRLEEQLKAAKRCGCEVFVIDYGWYDDKNQFCRYNDWDEATDYAFFGKMKNFSDKVRKAGLGFGFWVEFEFFYRESECVKQHPDWFFETQHSNCVCPKTWLPEVENYLIESLAKVIRRYKAVYIKNDMNHSQAYHPDHLNRYQKGIYKVMARLKHMLPEVTFENCSSGSLRMAAGRMLEAFDNHFISDNACPLENLRMFQNMVLRFPPGRIFHWYVASEMHSQNRVTPYEPGLIIQPQQATWYRFQPEDFDFGLLCNTMSPFGFSGDLASFSSENQKKIAQYTAFYKKYRDSFICSEAHLLTPLEDFDKQRGWIAIQISDSAKDLHFLYVFHNVSDGDITRAFHPAGLRSNIQYSITEIFPNKGKSVVKIKGKKLMENGVEFFFIPDMRKGFCGKMLMIQPTVK